MATDEKHPLIRVALFDLDDTLYDCLHQRLEVTHRHAAEAAQRIMAQHGIRAVVDDILAVRMRAFLTAPQLKHIDAEVSAAFGAERMHDEMSRAAHHAYFSCPVGELTLFPETLPTLRWLQKRGVRNFVISYGELSTQQAKIAALGLDKESSIEKIYVADRQKKRTKEAIFREILDRVEISAQEFLVIGDRASAEIAVGNRLGMHTVRVHAGEFAMLEPESKEEEAAHQIANIKELLSLPFSWGNES